MSITDADQLTEVQWRLAEDASFISGLWTLTEIAALFNQRQNRFNRDTKLMLAQNTVTVLSGATSVTLPDDWIATQRATWKTPTGVITPMSLTDRFAAANGVASANAPTVPYGLDDQSAGTRTGELFPTPATDGTLGLLYACTLEPLAFGITPDIFDVPDEFVPYILYGVLADLLSKDGRGQDLARAAYCESRYQEGVGLAAVLLGGFA